MPEDQQRENDRLIEQVVRRERGRLVASLVRHMGPHQIELAEDLVQEAIIAAIEHWPYRGIPDEPAAWLTKAAKNKLIDVMRRRKVETNYVRDVENEINTEPTNSELNEVRLLTPDDPELSLLFLCCHAKLIPQEQIALCLKLVGGFTALDIASLFFEKETATGQRLARAKRKLREDMISYSLSAEHIRVKIPTVLKALYLIFTHAYAPKKGARLIMRDTAFEALRIAETLQDYPASKTYEGAALAALFCFQAARFDAREDDTGNIVLLKDQDRTQWDSDLITKGFIYLSSAKQSDTITSYHIEAGMAAIHSTARDWKSTDWQALLRLYQTLERVNPSPSLQINKALILVQLGNIDDAQNIIDKVGKNQHTLTALSYHLVRAEIAKKKGDHLNAYKALKTALVLKTSDPVRHFLSDQAGSFTT